MGCIRHSGWSWLPYALEGVTVHARVWWAFSVVDAVLGGAPTVGQTLAHARQEVEARAFSGKVHHHQQQHDVGEHRHDKGNQLDGCLCAGIFGVAVQKVQ